MSEKYKRFQEYKKAKGLGGEQTAYKKSYKDSIKTQLDKVDADKLDAGLNKTKNLYDKVSPALKSKIQEQDKKARDDKISNDLSNMSDAELKKIVNRLNLEERYTQVMRSRYAEVGKSKTEAMLDAIGTALAIGGSVVSLMAAIKEVKK